MKHLEPLDAHRYLQEHPEAVFVDVRSQMEFMFVGHPVGDLDERQHRNTKNGWRVAGPPWQQH